MWEAKITLTVTEGNLNEKVYVFEKPTRCIVGRSEDCDIRAPMDMLHVDVSRHHCMLEIDPPHVRVRDLGSLNGTYVNGKKIGQRPNYQPAEDADLSGFPALDLNDGDEVRVGNNVLRVGAVASGEPLERMVVEAR
jgi:pSer/pThr/pTyr-binding forkhead associated (FHA) protein